MSRSLRDRAIRFARHRLSPETRFRVVKLQRKYRLQWPPKGSVQFGSFRRLTPISPIFGMDRGTPIDRYYIERFLESNADDIRGDVLELGDSRYTTMFGGKRVSRADVLNVVDSPSATIVADLTNADQIPPDRFDCIIFTQSLQMIEDMPAALQTLNRVLKPGGVLLMTSHGISKIGRRPPRDSWGEYWRITAQGASLLLRDFFADAEVQVEAYGNILTAVCSLHGLAADELTLDELNHRDPDFEVIIGVRAKLPGANDPG